MPSESHIPHDVEQDMTSEFMESFNTTILSEGIELADDLKQAGISLFNQQIICFQESIMSLMLVTLAHGVTLLHTEVLGVICKTTEVGIMCEPIKKYSTTRTRY